jgi:ADP-heptose:LPS heptosyltransferase
MKSLLKKAERTVRRFFIFILKMLFPAPHVPVKSIHKELQNGSIRKILFVGTSLKMGHFLCVTPLFRAFKDAYPDVAFCFLGNSTSASVASSSPCMSRVWVWGPSLFYRPANLIRFLKHLRREKFDLAIMLTTEMPSTTGVLLARLSGARALAGYAPRSSPLSPLTHAQIPYGLQTNEVQKFLDLGRCMGLEPKQHMPEFFVKEEDRIRARSFLQTNALSRRPLVGLFLGGKADRPERLWPVGSFVTLAKILWLEGIECLAINPPAASGEEKRLNEFLREFRLPPVVFQDNDLGRVAAMLGELNLLISPDGGVMHLSVAVGTPTLALFFETNPDVWYHPDPRQFYLRSQDNHSASLSAMEVFNKTKAILRSLSPSPKA